MNRVYVFDTTLRDGAQTEGVSFSVTDKIAVARLLDEIGADYIEGGWPGSNAKDLDFFLQTRHLRFANSKLVAFTSTRKKQQPVEKDENLQVLLHTGVEIATVVGKTWDFHVETALQTSLSENLAMIYDTVAYLKARGLQVFFDAEHFFDGFKRNPDYTAQTLRAAAEGGADWLVLCDTNGGMLPTEVRDIVAKVAQMKLGPLGIHAHNDGGLAVANSLAAIEAGATHVQVTVNGLGERCGNTDLCAVVPNLALKMGRETSIGVANLGRLKEVSERVYALSGRDPNPSQPFVGSSAFAHKAGIHVSAVVKNPMLYEHIFPETVGNSRKVVVSELSGMSNIVYALNKFRLPSPQDAVKRMLSRVKKAELDGYAFDRAETSLELLLRDELGMLDLHLDGIEAKVDANDGEFLATLYWNEHESERENHERKVTTGKGGTLAQALLHATGLQQSGFVWTGEHVYTVTMPERPTMYRAHVFGQMGDQTISTVGIGEAPERALAEAFLHVHQFARHNSFVALP